MVFDLELYTRCVVFNKTSSQNTGNCPNISQKPFTRPYKPICYISEKVVLLRYFYVILLTVLEHAKLLGGQLVVCPPGQA